MTTTPEWTDVGRRDVLRRPDVRFDRFDDKDPRSRAYDVAGLWLPPGGLGAVSRRWDCPVRLDQGMSGACVGFAWAHELAAEPDAVEGVDAAFARERIYFAAQRRDRFPGGAWPGAVPFAEGTSVLAGAKVVQELGFIAEYRWAFEVTDLLRAVARVGPAVFGCRWYAGMQEPEDGFARPDGAYLGKHCVLVSGVEVVRDLSGAVDRESSHVVILNSFGADWGDDGTARLRLSDVEALWDGAETCIPLVRTGGDVAGAAGVSTCR